jgi:hypothetical protein
MRYLLSDEEADPARLLRPRTRNFCLAEVEGAENGGAAAVLSLFITGLRPITSTCWPGRRSLALAWVTRAGTRRTTTISIPATSHSKGY